MKAELKRKVVDQLIEIVEEGGSFQAGFSSLAGLPTNAVTGNKYTNKVYKTRSIEAQARQIAVVNEV